MKKRNCPICNLKQAEVINGGYFTRENFKRKFNTKPVPQLTSFCLSALGILNASPKYNFKFLDQWRKPEYVYNYLRDKGCFHGLPGSGV